MLIMAELRDGPEEYGSVILGEWMCLLKLTHIPTRREWLLGWILAQTAIIKNVRKFYGNLIPPVLIASLTTLLYHIPSYSSLWGYWLRTRGLVPQIESRVGGRWSLAITVVIFLCCLSGRVSLPCHRGVWRRVQRLFEEIQTRIPPKSQPRRQTGVVMEIPLARNLITEHLRLIGVQIVNYSEFVTEHRGVMIHFQRLGISLMALSTIQRHILMTLSRQRRNGSDGRRKNFTELEIRGDSDIPMVSNRNTFYSAPRCLCLNWSSIH